MRHRSPYSMAARGRRVLLSRMRVGGLLFGIAAGIVGFLLLRGRIPGELLTEFTVAMFAPAAAYLAWWLLLEGPRLGRGSSDDSATAVAAAERMEAVVSAALVADDSRCFVRPAAIGRSSTGFHGRTRISGQAVPPEMRRSLAAARMRGTAAATPKPQAAS